MKFFNVKNFSSMTINFTNPKEFSVCFDILVKLLDFLHSTSQQVLFEMLKCWTLEDPETIKCRFPSCDHSTVIWEEVDEVNECSWKTTSVSNSVVLPKQTNQQHHDSQHCFRGRTRYSLVVSLFLCVLSGDFSLSFFSFLSSSSFFHFPQIFKMSWKFFEMECWYWFDKLQCWNDKFWELFHLNSWLSNHSLSIIERNDLIFQNFHCSQMVICFPF